MILINLNIHKKTSSDFEVLVLITVDSKPEPHGAPRKSTTHVILTGYFYLPMVSQ